jgi:hypothetical protein
MEDSWPENQTCDEQSGIERRRHEEKRNVAVRDSRKPLLKFTFAFIQEEKGFRVRARHWKPLVANMAFSESERSRAEGMLFPGSLTGSLFLRSCFASVAGHGEFLVPGTRPDFGAEKYRTICGPSHGISHLSRSELSHDIRQDNSAVCNLTAR